jgi:hypothetical protein
VKTSSASPGRIAAFVPLAALAIALINGSLGCEQADEIAAYETRRTEPRVTAVDPDEVRAILDHMFAAVVPAEGKAWFFKLVVPGADAEAMREPFDKFLATVDVSESSDGRPAWRLPEGWTAQEGGSAMRAATIVVPHGDKKYEITVSNLPLMGDWDAFLQVNVERWLGQLQEPPLKPALLKKLAHTIPTQHGDATRFELVGKMQANPMGAGLAGMPAGHPPVSERTPAGPAETAPEPRPAATDGPSAPGVNEKLSYEAPPTWKAQAIVPGPFKREASFKAESADGQADFAVTKFPATGQMADLGANVTRWAAQVGVTGLTDDQIVQAARKITLADEPALQFEFFSPTGNARPQGIIAVMAKRGDMVWFFKLSGSKATVENERDALDAFLKSVRFAAAT